MELIRTSTILQSEPTQHKGEHLDRKRTLPRRVLKLALALSILTPGEYVFVVRVPSEGDLNWKQAPLIGV